MFLSFFQGSKICHCVFLRSELPNINRMINPRRAPCHKGTTQCSSSFLEFGPFFPAAVPATIPAFGPFTLPGSEKLVCSSHGCQEGGNTLREERWLEKERGEKCQEFHAIYYRSAGQSPYSSLGPSLVVRNSFERKRHLRKIKWL